MRKLLIFSRSHAPRGGADRIVADICRELPSRGWNVVLGVTLGAVFNDVQRYLDVLGHDLPAVAVDGSRGTRASRLAALRSMIRRERPDVVLSMRVFDAYEAVALEKRANAGPRLAVGVRSFEPPYLADLALYRENVDLCVTSGALIAGAATGHCGIDASRVVSIGGGVHPPRSQPVARSPNVPLRLLYAGRIDNGQKRVLDLVPFLDALDKRGVAVELDVAGTGPAEAELRALLAAREASGLVRFHGWVDQEVLCGTLYRQADCFVHFAAWEGMTIAPREAMAHGAVPVISRFRGLETERQFVDGETALTFDIGCTDAAAECVERLACQKGLLTRLSAAAIETQRGVYSFGGAMDAWAAAFDRCLAMPRRIGARPHVPERFDGRLARWGVPPSVQSRVYALTGRRVRHSSPGSEWPTASGLMSDSTRRSIEEYARGLEERAV